MWKPPMKSVPLEQVTKNLLLNLTWYLPLPYLVLDEEKKTFVTPFLDPVKYSFRTVVLFYYIVKSNTKLKLIDKVYRKRKVLFKMYYVCLWDSMQIKLYVYVYLQLFCLIFFTWKCIFLSKNLIYKKCNHKLYSRKLYD